jgi:putative SOS response-associated peptidase YedK
LPDLDRLDRHPRTRKEPTVNGPHLAYAFLTPEPNAVVKPIHPKAMPVILHQDDWETWLTADALPVVRRRIVVRITVAENDAALLAR